MGYDPSHYALLASAEDRHFWFRARAQVLERSVARVMPPGVTRPRVLEIGCGTGTSLRALRRGSPAAWIVALDLHDEGLRRARARGADAAFVRGRAEDPPFQASFHLVGMFDVLEHLPDDEAALRRVRPLLERDGLLMVTVPAHQFLWSAFDVAAGHCRRYTRRELRARLERCGYTVVFATYYMTTLLPLVWMARKVASRRDGEAPLARDLRAPGIVNTVLGGVLGLEARRVAAGRRLPFGSSLFAIARAT